MSVSAAWYNGADPALVRVLLLERGREREHREKEEREGEKEINVWRGGEVKEKGSEADGGVAGGCVCVWVYDLRFCVGLSHCVCVSVGARVWGGGGAVVCW